MKQRLHRWMITFGLTSLLFAGLIGCDKKNTKSTTENTTQTTVAKEQTSEEEKVEVQTVSEFSISLSSNNSWESNGMVCAQFDGVIKNQSGAPEKDWKVTITVPDGSKLESSWKGT